MNQSSGDGGQIRIILVIDDEPDFCTAIEGALSLHGYHVLTARGGWEGAALAAEHEPDLILCDVDMKDGDGYEALADIRGNTALAKTPFLLMTQAPSSASMLYGMQLSVDDYLPKPFTIEQLLLAMDQAFKARE
ncbi:MAG: response regulator [Verrucomicrobia bacterium]|nr:response regulator [Verrucomicrobiota bacterium]